MPLTNAILPTPLPRMPFPHKLQRPPSWLGRMEEEVTVPKGAAVATPPVKCLWAVPGWWPQVCGRHPRARGHRGGGSAPVSRARPCFPDPGNPGVRPGGRGGPGWQGEGAWASDVGTPLQGEGSAGRRAGRKSRRLRTSAWMPTSPHAPWGPGSRPPGSAGRSHCSGFSAA